MRMRHLLGERFKETPSDCQIASHALMVRGGYIRQLCNGIYSLYPPARRITRKIEQIIREEMDAIGGQEVLFPVVMPASLWQESGRYESIGSEMARFQDRSGGDVVLGMTHEEAAVQLARGAAKSYADYPFMIYQIQTKFRDEPRCRGGLIRVREFTMKDAYSFHTSQEDLERYYEQCRKAYRRIFARAGVPEVVDVKSDSGMMGGSTAHEFMLLTPAGEDSIVLCGSCGYRSNMEAAECVIQNPAAEPAPLQKIATPGVKTIDELCAFLHLRPEQTCKAVVYQKDADGQYVAVFIRGDLEVNETKLRNLLKAELHPATQISEDSGLTPGSIGAIGLSDRIQVVFDRSMEGIPCTVCGANEDGYHLTGVSLERDLPEKPVFFDVAKALEGGICPVCGQPHLQIRRGIEVGNIFQLGEKYTRPMGMQYLDREGKLQYPLMGCYGIGVGRLAAAVCEVRHDDYGPIWPMAIAPWQVHICALKAADPQVKKTAEELYAQLSRAGVEVIFDDRPVSAGVMFSDADLLGVPLRLVVSPKTCARGIVELAARNKAFREEIAPEAALQAVQAKIQSALAEGKKG